MNILYYIHDPMCSWCWAFRPVWQALNPLLGGNIVSQKVLGGLAEDTDQDMPLAMQETLRQTWQRIQKRVPECEFNFDFWTQAKPRRSTWPACRAVLAAMAQDALAADEMIYAIQQAYYLHAKNPSDTSVLLGLAAQIGLDAGRFETDLHSQAMHDQLQQQIALAHELGVSSFPSLVLDVQGSRWPISVDYASAEAILQQIKSIMEMSE